MKSKPTNTDVRKTIGRNITQLLADRQWSQHRLAQETGDPEMTISRVARGINVPGAGLLLRIADCLGVTTDDLLRRPQKNSRKISG